LFQYVSINSGLLGIEPISLAASRLYSDRVTTSASASISGSGDLANLARSAAHSSSSPLAVAIAFATNASFDDQRRYKVVRATPASSAICSTLAPSTPLSMKTLSAARRIA
jgi:hypothetical protein